MRIPENDPVYVGSISQVGSDVSGKITIQYRLDSFGERAVEIVIWDKTRDCEASILLHPGAANVIACHIQHAIHDCCINVEALIGHDVNETDA